MSEHRATISWHKETESFDYNDFDREIKGERQVDYRTPFQQDRDRLVHTGAFRRPTPPQLSLFPGD